MTLDRARERGDASGELERDSTALFPSSILINVTEAPIPRTTIPVSPSISKYW